ncbi:DUF2490 domain-containing protein [Larkinella bovis]|uniref:DUF2490 domain-containing protein n=1 Tax=Larkinella bovis TaxID=683041 RepID=A0ABW0IKC3_9BACT
MYPSLVAFCLLFLGLLPAFSQHKYMTGTLTQLNVNFPVFKKFKLNTKLESRQIFREKELNEVANRQFRYERTDLSLVLTRKLSVDNTLGGGYFIRLEDGQLTHRLIQQFNHVRNLDMVIMAHRVVTDETFQPGEPIEVRLRYRLGMEKALNGRQIDPKELYLKVNNEYLGTWSSPATDLEIRGALALGYNSTDTNKIELGLEYRVNEFNQPQQAHQFWATVSFFVSI